MKDDDEKHERLEAIYRREAEEVDLRSLFSVALRNSFFILGTAFLLAAGTWLVSKHFIQKTYKSYTVIMPADTKSKSISSRLGRFGEGGGFSALQSFGKPAQEMARYYEILSGRQLMGNIVDSLKLLDRGFVDFDEDLPFSRQRAREDLIDIIEDQSVLELDAEVIKISFVDEDPKFAYEVVQAYLSELKSFLQQNTMTQAKATELFIAERIEETREDLAELEREFIQLQQETGVVELPSQSGLSLSQAAELRSKLIEKDMEISLYQDILKNSADIERLKNEKAQIQQQLNRLVRGEKRTGKEDVEIFTPLSEVPGLQMKFASTERRYLTMVRLLETLEQQYEVARIETKKNEPVFQVIDAPREPLAPAGPAVRKNTVLAFVVGMMLSMLLVLTLNHMQRVPRPMVHFVKLDVRKKDREKPKSFEQA